jgi:hypothetical protein
MRAWSGPGSACRCRITGTFRKKESSSNRRGSQMTEQDKAFGGGEGSDQPEAGGYEKEHAGGLGEDEEGRAKAQATEKIGEQDQVKEQTASPAPEEDVGAPPMEGGEVDNP